MRLNSLWCHRKFLGKAVSKREACQMKRLIKYFVSRIIVPGFEDFTGLHRQGLLRGPAGKKCHIVTIYSSAFT